MIINHNLASLNTYRQLSINGDNTQKSLAKLSSGLRINKAGDDAAGLAISEKMRGQIRGLDQAARNAQDGISMIQTAEGALNETHSILQRMRELAVQAGNDTNTTADRGEIQKEMNQLTSEINRIGNTTEFNTQKLLDGGAVGSAEASGSTLANGSAAVLAATTTYTIDLSGTLTTGKSISFNIGTYSFSAAVSASTAASTASNVYVSGASQNADATDLSESIDLWLQSKGLDANWDAAVNGTNDVTISYKSTGIAGNGAVTNFNDNTSGNVADALLYTPGANAAPAAKATGTISFSDNMLSSGTSIAIDDKSFILYDSSAGEVAATGASVHAIDIAGMKSSEELIDAIVAADDTTNTTLSKTSSTVLSVTADAAGTAGNAYVLSVTAPAGQQNSFTADFQIGANKGQSMSIEMGDMRAKALGISSLAGTSTTVTIDGTSHDVAWATSRSVTNGTNNVAAEFSLSVASHDDAAKSVDVLDAAISKVSAERSKLGAYQNRLDHTINNLGTTSENLTASESRIRDVDMAKEMMEFTKNNILSQAAQAMLAQANQQPQGVLQLLR